MKGVKKKDLPEKVCVACGRPFTWRKKWEKVWQEVNYCSDRCRSKRTAQKRISAVATVAGSAVCVPPVYREITSSGRKIDFAIGEISWCWRPYFFVLQKLLLF